MSDDAEDIHRRVERAVKTIAAFTDVITHITTLDTRLTQLERTVEAQADEITDLREQLAARSGDA